MAGLDRSFGRQAFGDDPANYDAARPAYPDAVWQALRERAGLRAGIDILEIGAGTGIATRQLLIHQPARLVAVEPDPRLASYLTGRHAGLEVVAEPFEMIDLRERSFDLVVSATAFHWLEPVPALRRVAALLRSSGRVVLWWNAFADPNRADAFHDATVHLFSRKVVNQAEFALDAAARLADFADADFLADPPQLLPWTLHLDPDGVRRLYASFSNVNVLAPDARTRLLDGLVDVAVNQFRGHVERNMVTAIYTARPDPAPGP